MRGADPRRRRVILKSGIAELRHPGVAVVLRVVHAARAAESPFGDRNAEVIVEAREVRAAAGIAHRRLGGVGHGARAPPLAVDAALAVRIGTTRATSRSVARSDGDPPPLNRGPCAATSWLKYATASRLKPQRIVLDVLRRSDQVPTLPRPMSRR